MGLIVLGIVLLGLAGLLGVMDILLSVSLLPFSVRVGILGVLVAIFGVAGYIAIGVFEHRPEP